MRPFLINRTTYKVSDIVGWLKAGSLNLSPSFQRRSVWRKGAKSYLVDTVVRGFPMPIIFLREKGVNIHTLESNREVVDGQQRIRTLVSFIQPKLLKDFDPDRDEFTVSDAHNDELADMKFTELEDELQQRILNYEFSVHVLPASTDDRQVLQIFARMNSTGVKLSPQELRNAKFYGQFKTFAYDLAFANLFRWRSWGVFSEDGISRMEEVELTSELMMFVIDGLKGKSQASIDAAYKKYDLKLPEKVKLRKRIEHALEQIDAAIGSSLVDTPFAKKALFYPLFVAVYHQAVGKASLTDKASLKSLRPRDVAGLKKVAKQIADLNAPRAVLEAIERRTTHASSRKTISDYITTALNG